MNDINTIYASLDDIEDRLRVLEKPGLTQKDKLILETDVAYWKKKADAYVIILHSLGHTIE